MKNRKDAFLKRIISVMICIVIFVPYGTISLAEENKIIFSEDFQNLPEGASPAYGSSNWTGDTAATHSTCKTGVVNEHGNKVFKMEYVGTGTNKFVDPLIYRNLNVAENEKHTFYLSIKTDDANSYKQVFLRSATAVKSELFSFNGPYIYTVGMVTGKAEPGKWYNIKVVLDGSEKSADVYVNDKYGGTLYMKSWDMTNMSMRVTMLGANAEGAVTNFYLDNTAYVNGTQKVDFEVPEYVENTEPAGEGENAPEPAGEITDTSLTVFCIDNSKVYANAAVTDTGIKTTVYRGNTFIPARNLANIYGGEIEWVSDGAYARMKLNDKDIKISSSAVEIDGSGQDVSVMPVNLKGRMYVEAETAALITDKILEVNENGAVVLSDKEADEGVVNTIIKKISFSEPTAEQILLDFKKHNPEQAHPRILMDGDRLEKIKKYLNTYDNFKEWYANVKAEADKALAAPIPVYELRDGERLLYVSRDVMSHVIYPAFVYLIEGDRKYFDRAMAELTAVSEFPDWHPAHFLDTAEMTLAFAIGYDWLYNDMTRKQREKISTAILRLGLDAANEAYEGTAEYDPSAAGAAHNRVGWKNDKSNWGLVCNGGITAGACAVMGDAEPKYCAQIISKALKSSETPLQMFAPDGAWPEGIGYWSYACNYLSYMLSCVKNLTGTDYGYTMVPGILATANFPVYLTGPNGTFNYGDAGEAAVNAPVLFWFANELEEPSLNDARLSMMERFGQKGGIYDILYYDPEMPSVEADQEKDKKFRITEIAVTTSSTSNNNANYLGMKGGVIGSSHGDLDAGVFMLDALGRRWTADFGADSYSLPGYWYWPQRADYYKKRAEGHSTLVINPDGTPDQIPNANTVITDFVSGVNGSCSVLDMTGAYAKNADKVRRAAVLFDDRNKMMIRDEVRCKAPSDVYWFMQTKMTDITVAPDGKSLVISDGDNSFGGRRLKLILSSDCPNAVFSYDAAKPLPQSPEGAGQQDSSYAKRIQVKSTGVTKLNMQVVFIPYIAGEGCDDTNLPELGTIDDFVSQKTYDFDKQSYTTLDDLRINGKTVEFFDPPVKYYTYKTDVYDKDDMKVEAVSGKYDVSVNKQEDITEIIVSDPGGVLKTNKYYVICDVNRLKTQIDSSLKEIAVSEVTASDVPEPANTPQNTIDNDVSTKWAANGYQWIQYDLGEVKSLNAIGLLWMKAATRSERFAVSVSSDGKSFRQIVSARSLAVQNDYEYVIMSDIPVRYVRISVDGNNESTWTSLMETKFFER
ncbi:MAG: discoidin domain-containing protein [Clostridia bacterium]|nr:discoidin domain-containing protein [Clostridia bacterium]